MNIKRIFKTSIIGCSIILGIATNAQSTTKGATDHNVNSKVFQHKVAIDVIDGVYYYYAPKKKEYIKNNNQILIKPTMNHYYNKGVKFYQACEDESDEYDYPDHNCHYALNHRIPMDSSEALIDYNQRDQEFKYKFNKLYGEKIANGLLKDAKSCFEAAVPRIFGKDYTFIKNLKYPEKREKLKKEYDKIKEFTTYIRLESWGDFENLMKRNGLELVSTIKYEWKGNATNDKNEVKEFDMDSIYYNLFRENIILISNGNNVLCYNRQTHELNIYHKTNNTNKDYCNNPDEVIDKFNKLGLFLQEKFEAEEKAVRDTIDPRAILQYEE